MDPLTMAAIGAGVGILKGRNDQRNAVKQQNIQAEVARYSPWTGFSPQHVPDADIVGTTMQGGMQGAALGQSMARANQENQWFQDQRALRPGSPYVNMTNTPPGSMVG